jgi:hypothetical protein
MLAVDAKFGYNTAIFLAQAPSLGLEKNRKNKKIGYSSFFDIRSRLAR